MLKRLIEVALPLKEVSEQSAREKSIRHGHISTLHIWWARRPLAACRAAVFASLIPDPDDPECPDEYRTLVQEVLARSEFKPKNGDGTPAADTPRNRCLEFIKHLVKWESSNNPEYIEPARKLIAAAHKILRPDAASSPPNVLDPFAGGGAIPLEVSRLGCDAHAVDLNPVAHLIQLCTLVYPQQYGQPDSRPIPEYIRRLVGHNWAKRKARGETSLFGNDSAYIGAEDGEVFPDVKITEEEYRLNPLAVDVKYWGYWVLERARRELFQFYDTEAEGHFPAAYIWARTVNCPNPQCKAALPLVSQLWLCKKTDRKVAARMDRDPSSNGIEFSVVEGREIDFDPDAGTVQRGNAECPLCRQVAPAAYIRSEFSAGRMGQQLMAVVTVRRDSTGKNYRGPSQADATAFESAVRALQLLLETDGGDCVPTEDIQCYEPRRISPPLYGLNRFADLFNDRQLLSLATITKSAKEVFTKVESIHGADYARAVVSLLAMPIDWFVDKESTLARWHTSGEKVSGTFGRQALGIVWNYAEVNPLSSVTGGVVAGFEWTDRVIKATSPVARIADVRQGSATRLPTDNDFFDAVVSDPPYYDAVPYSILSDFFYVWLKRLVGDSYPEIFRTPSTPKGQEAIEQRPHKLLTNRKDKEYYENIMAQSFAEARRTLVPQGIACIMFAHKSTTAWESLIVGLLQSGLIVSASWPLHTEMQTRMNARGTASLASSVTMVCRKRTEDAGDGLWDDVRQEVKTVAKERLDFFWDQGIRGADFFISAIGPALSVFGRYAKVIRLSGKEVTVGEFLDEVRGLVTGYALTKILHTTNTATIDPESRFYVVWKWSYADSKVPADESFKMAQALGIDTEEMWDKTGVLKKSAENVQCVPVEKRMKIKDLGEPSVDGAPASLIDVLHRMCAFRDKNDSQGMAQFLGNSGHANNSTLWLVAQAVSEILPDGDKEKQLMQGLLNQREGLEEATRQRELF
jgi:adenine-specific DNA methylase